MARAQRWQRKWQEPCDLGRLTGPLLHSPRTRELPSHLGALRLGAPRQRRDDSRERRRPPWAPDQARKGGVGCAGDMICSCDLCGATPGTDTPSQPRPPAIYLLTSCLKGLGGLWGTEAEVPRWFLSWARLLLQRAAKPRPHSSGTGICLMLFFIR